MPWLARWMRNFSIALKVAGNGDDMMEDVVNVESWMVWKDEFEGDGVLKNR